MSAHGEFTEMTSTSCNWNGFFWFLHVWENTRGHLCLSAGGMRPWSELKMPASGCTMLRAMPLLPLLLNTASGFKLCPGHCLCYESSDLVDCRSRGLVQVPPGVPHGTWLLDLSGNKLTEVRSRSFVGLWSLKILLMSNSSIQTLQPQVPKTLHVHFISLCIFCR